MKQKMGVVIISYNSASELKACILAAKTAIHTAGLDSEVVVIDNHSKDKSIAVAKTAGAHVIANNVNVGFSKAANAGIKYLFSENAHYVLILNPDAIVLPASLTKMVAALKLDSSIGAVGPAMIDEHNKPSTSGYYLKAPSWLSILLYSTFLRPRFLHRKFFVAHVYEEVGLDSDRAVEQIPGACLLTTRSVLEHTGLLDEDFAIWFEDVEWCYRARKHGYKMWFCHDAIAQHEGGVTFAKWQDLNKAVTFYVSMKTFFRKHKPLSYPLVVLTIIGNSLVLYVKNKDRSNLAFVKKFLQLKYGKLPD